ncbi:hypothetical protein [Arthrobacter mangrovi]|nr:hypothetical protein [Arthrobacter mangrovi]
MRKESYLALSTECRHLSRWVAMRGRVGYLGKDNEYGEPPPDWTKGALGHLAEVEMFASEPAALAARRLTKRILAELPGAAVGHMMQSDSDLEAFRRAAQRDLGLQETAFKDRGLRQR